MGETVLQPKFIKPFSRGQVTIPKTYRDYLGIDEESWLKVSLQNKKILLQPVKSIRVKESRVAKAKIDLNTYRENILKIKGAWFGEKEFKDFKKMRREIEERLAENEKNLG